MLRRKLSSVGLLCLAIPAMQAQSVAVLPGATSSSNQITFYSGGSFNSPLTVTGAAPGAYQAISSLDGSKYYILSSSSTAPLTVIDSKTGNLRVVTDISARPSAAALSPDGKLLAVSVYGYVYVFSTANDRLVPVNTPGTNPIYLGGAGNSTDLAFSQDSSTLYVASTLNSNGYVSAYDLTSYTQKAQVTFFGSVGGGQIYIATGPTGLLYLSIPNKIRELNPQNLTTVSEMPVTGSPSKPAFTPDGQYLIALNKTPLTGNVSLWVFNLSNHSSYGTFPMFQGGVVLDQIYFAGSDRIFVTSSQPNTLYELTLANGVSLDISKLNGVIPADAVSSVALSNEFPAKSLYVVTANQSGQKNLVNINLQTNQIAAQTALGSEPYALVYLTPVATSGAAGAIGFNTTQTLGPGSVSLPLTVRVVDAQGRPVYNVPVAFAITTGTGVNLSATSAITNLQGYASVTATATSVPTTGQANVVVTATAQGVAGVNFNLTLSPTGGIGGGGSGNSGTGLSIVSGNGQLVQSALLSGQPLTVLLKDSNGAPVANAPVVFTVVPSNAGSAGTAYTDEKGIASVNFSASQVPPGQSYLPAVVTATANGGTVNFVVTAYPRVDSNGGALAPPTAMVVKPDPGTVYSGAAGTVIPGAIQIRVGAGGGAYAGQPIPNVSLNITSPGSTTPLASCKGGTPLTNDQGVATCDLVLGPGVATNGVLNVNIGGFRDANPIFLNVTPGLTPGAIQITAGNNGSGAPGQTITLTAKVVTSTGDAVSGQTATWQVVQGSGIVSPIAGTTDANGTVSTKLTLGQSPGTVQVKLTVGTLNATFTNTVGAAIGSIQISSGNNQSAGVGQAFGQPLIVIVRDANNQPSANVPVTFTVQSGGATLSAASATTNAQGLAQVTATAGQNAGNVVIVATAGGQSQNFTLTTTTVPAGPVVTASGFVNGASNLSGISPCSIAIVSGTGLTPGLQGTTLGNPSGVGPLPTTLTLPSSGSLSISVNGVAAPIFWGNNGGAQQQVAFQVPCETQPGNATVAITVNGTPVTVQGVAVSSFAPGVFTYIASDNKQYAVLQRSDGSYVSPQNPAHRGETVTLFATGLGQVTPATTTNAAGVGQPVVAQLIAGLNNQGVRVVSSQLLPGQIGLYAVTFEVPADTTPGPYQPVGFAIVDNGNLVFAPGTFTPIQ